MKTAVVTGASSGIGLAVSKKLIDIGFHVYGLARDFSKTDLQHEHWNPMSCDLTDVKQLCRSAESIRQSGKPIDVLVNNAGVGYFGPHEQLKPAQIAEMVSLNLQAPLILAQQFLRDLKKSQGWLINISSITAEKPSTHGCGYAATKAGLSHFGFSLFEEIRKTGAKVVTLQPDMTQTRFYDRLDFREGDSEEQFITAACVADAVESVLAMRPGTVITEMTIRPQKHGIVRKRPGE